MADETTNPCDDVCPVVVEIGEIERIYDSLSAKVYADMDKHYKEGKISGPTYSATWTELMKAVVAGAMQSVVALQNKETAADRAVKYEQVDSSQSKTANETCIATSTCELNAAKKKAEDIKNGDEEDGTSLYGYNKLMVDSQTKLYERQKGSFDDNARQKYMDTLTGPYSILFQDLELDDNNLPNCLTDAGIDKAANEVFNNLA